MEERLQALNANIIITDKIINNHRRIELTGLNPSFYKVNIKELKNAKNNITKYCKKLLQYVNIKTEQEKQNEQ